MKKLLYIVSGLCLLTPACMTGESAESLEMRKKMRSGFMKKAKPRKLSDLKKDRDPAAESKKKKAEAAEASLKDAPDFKLKDRDGELYSLDSFEDRYLLIDFWASWCMPCLKAVPALNKIQKKYKDELSVLGISIDRGGWKDVKRATRRVSMDYPVVLGDSRLMKDYQVKNIPYLVLIKNGKIRKTLIGYHDLEDLEEALEPWLN